MQTRQNANRTLRRTQAWRGFTLIELLIVVAIILVIAAIAIPSLLRARIAANESSAVAHVRAIVTASTAYSSTWDNGYPPTLDALGGTGTAATCDASLLLDTLLTSPPYEKAGYTFGYTPVGAPVTTGPGCGSPGANAYLVTATPVNSGFTGQRSFCSDTPGVIHFDLSGVTPASTAACDALPSL
jgi:type IV pilus assembly protein PilA